MIRRWRMRPRLQHYYFENQVISVPGQVGPGTHMHGLATYQDLVRRNSPERDLAAFDVTFSSEIETDALDEE